MRVVQIGEAFPSLAYRCPGPGGITRERHLDRHEVTVDVLPGNLQAIVATGDLQGREDVPPHRLLGEAVADALSDLAELFSRPTVYRTLARQASR